MHRREPHKSVVYACIIQNNNACKNLLLYIFKHEISRKKIIRENEENNCTRKL